jgi:hypothetical protein
LKADKDLVLRSALTKSRPADVPVVMHASILGETPSALKVFFLVRVASKVQEGPHPAGRVIMSLALPLKCASRLA